VLINRTIAHQILKASLSDGAKVAALTALPTDSRSARDIATSTGRSVRSVERHYAELRTWDNANLRRWASRPSSRFVCHGTARPRLNGSLFANHANDAQET
jgi:hypothetical protein